MYKLADGSLSTDYKVGDEFEVVDGEDSWVNKGGVVAFLRDDNSKEPYFKLISGNTDGNFEEYCCSWKALKPHRKQFTKADLKDGMVVTYRNGEDRTFIKGGLYSAPLGNGNIYWKGALSGDWSESLECINFRPKDIMKVSYMGETLWEREEETAAQKEIKRLRGVIEDAQKALSKLEG